MINLLPRQQQKEIRAARSNTLLLRYTILLICALLFLTGAIGVTYFSLTQAAKHAEALKQENETKAADYAQTQAEVSQLQSELSSAKSLFENEVRYSKALTRLSNIFPDGTAIDALELNASSFSEQMTLNVQVRDQEAAEKLLQSFSSSQYISGANLGKISTSASGRYPYTVELIFTLNKAIAK